MQKRLIVSALTAALTTFAAVAAAQSGAAVPTISSDAAEHHCSKEEIEKCKRAAAEAAAMKSTKPSEIPAGQVSFFTVGLVCKSAPKIGCGSKAKPVLLALNANSHVAGTWLNEAGTRLAIGWKQNTKPLTVDQLDAVIDPYGIALQTTSENTREDLLASFTTSTRWYDAASVDRLSEQEAAVIAERLVRRVSARTALDLKHAARLREAFEQTFHDRFINSGSSSDRADELVKVAKSVVDGPTLIAVREAVALGTRPLPNEE